MIASAEILDEGNVHAVDKHAAPELCVRPAHVLVVAAAGPFGPHVGESFHHDRMRWYICSPDTTASRQSAGSPNANTRIAHTHTASGGNQAPLRLGPSATRPRPARPLVCDDTPSGTRSADESDRGPVFAVSADSPLPSHPKLAWPSNCACFITTGQSTVRAASHRSVSQRLLLRACKNLFRMFAGSR